MASLVDLDEQVTAVDDRLKDVADALASKDAQYKPKSWDPNFTGSRGVVAIPQFSDARNSLLNLQKQLQTQRNNLVIKIQQAAATYKPLVGPQTGIKKKEQAIIKKFGVAPVAGPAVPTTTTAATRTVGGERVAAPDIAAEIAGQRLNVPQPEGDGGGGGGGGMGRGAAGPVTKAQVDAALVASGLPDTPENRKTIRADLKAGKEPVGDWLTVFKREFPQYQYLLDETTFGADVTELLQRAVTQKWYESDQFETLMDQGFSGTQYFQNTTTAQQNFDKATAANKQSQIDQFKLLVQQSFGNLQFDDATLTTIATKAARDNRQGKALELYVYQESFAKPAGTTSFAQPTAATRALTSSAADAVRQIGRDYGSKVTDQEVQDVLTGKTTIDDLRQTYKIAARRWYKGAAEDIDAGVTVEQLFRPYKQYAAAILGKPLEQIDLVDANGKPTLYAEALEGQDGPMSISQWTQKLKSDDRFGWQYTPEAKQKATSLVMDLEKAFGFRA